jgi:hypothetical protein
VNGTPEPDRAEICRKIEELADLLTQVKTVKSTETPQVRYEDTIARASDPTFIDPRHGGTYVSNIAMIALGSVLLGSIGHHIDQRATTTSLILDVAALGLYVVAIVTRS